MPEKVLFDSALIKRKIIVNDDSVIMQSILRSGKKHNVIMSKEEFVDAINFYGDVLMKRV